MIPRIQPALFLLSKKVILVTIRLDFIDLGSVFPIIMQIPN
jgi:hypothetical protein